MAKKNIVKGEKYFAVNFEGGDELDAGCEFFYDKEALAEAFEQGDLDENVHIMEVQVIKHYHVAPKFEMESE